MSSIALIPVKSLTEAKRRLARELNPRERRVLVIAMLEDVLTALGKSRAFPEIYIISPDQSLARTASQHRAGFIRQKGAGLNAAIRQAERYLSRKRASSVTTVLADLPLAGPSDFGELARIGGQSRRVVLAPSLKGGTNVMLRVPPNAIKTSYGRWSYAKHLRAGQGKNLPVYSISNTRLSFDVDTVEDLRVLLDLDRSSRTSAARVARKLLSIHN